MAYTANELIRGVNRFSGRGDFFAPRQEGLVERKFLIPIEAEIEAGFRGRLNCFSESL